MSTSYCNCHHPGYLRYQAVDTNEQGCCEKCGYEVVWAAPKHELFPRGSITGNSHSGIHGYRPVVVYAKAWFDKGYSELTRDIVRGVRET
tara:strand:+ start:805 stop:1074 length:270 start_codon:yes stop_codon:yes gene_type:complete